LRGRHLRGVILENLAKGGIQNGKRSERIGFDPQAAGITQDDGVSGEAGDPVFASVPRERKLGLVVTPSTVVAGV
jgi:hypothetical protein